MIGGRGRVGLVGLGFVNVNVNLWDSDGMDCRKAAVLDGM